MGGGEAPSSKEYILCLIPFPKNQAVLEKIEKRHPNVEITYIQTTSRSADDYPEGKHMILRCML